MTKGDVRPVHPAAQGICGCPIYLDSKLVEHRERCPYPPAAAQATAWNRFYEDRGLSPIGAPVRYWTGDRTGPGKPGTVKHAAQVLGGHTAVLWVEEHGACIALTHVEHALARWRDANGEHWHPAGHDEFGQGWLRCLETDRGARNKSSVEREFGPLTVIAHPRPGPGSAAGAGQGPRMPSMRDGRLHDAPGRHARLPGRRC